MMARTQTDDVFDIIGRHSARAPVDIVAIINDLGIAYERERLPDKDSGLIEHVGDGYRIVVNGQHAPVRQRFTAAHELGHYTYHRDLIGAGILDDAMYRSSTEGKYANSRVTKAHESQANRFAANVLMPRALIQSLCQDNGLILPRDIGKLASMLQVSEQALRIRLGY